MFTNIEISSPAKTFLIGEYSVLDGGSAILLNTSPRFSCFISKGPFNSSFPPKSATGQWVRKNWDIFKDVQFEWNNPYKDKQGLGFSSAQFNILYAYTQLAKGLSLVEVRIEKLWQDYLSLDFEGQIPSGADVLSQWVGDVSMFKQDPFELYSITSSLPDVDCFLIHTNERVKTHEHLKNLKLPNLSHLKTLSDQACEAVKASQDKELMSLVTEYSKTLKDLGFFIPSVYSLVEELMEIPEVLSAKGCGAMSAEVVIVFCNKKDTSSLRNKLKHVDIISDSSCLTYGTEFHEKGSFKKALL